VFIFATAALSAVGYAQTPISSSDGYYQIGYATNLSFGDSYVNISNDGAGMTTTSIQAAQNSLAVSGSLCANVYAFNPDEEIISCCSCAITPNGLVSLSVKRDLLNNPLTGRATPSSVVIKLVATMPPGTGVGTAGNPCGSSASLGALPGSPAEFPANGMVAWGTRLHENSAAGSTYALTETPFTVARPSGFELSRLANICAFIQAQGSGYGTCNSCEQGGLGGSPSDQ
jgi:hypothetical protein